MLNSSLPADDASRTEYLLACFQSANEELLARVRQREEWIKFQIVAQVVVLALANGVKLLGAEPTSRVFWVQALALPVSCVVCILYVVEDRLVKHLADYIGDLSAIEAKLQATTTFIPNFDSSEHLKAFFHETLGYRIISQFIVFLLIPVGIAIAYRWSSPSRSSVGWMLIAVDALVALTIASVLFANARFRYRQNRVAASRT